MNSVEPGQTFEAARRQHLIDATIEALADVGFKAASLSQIARRADVSTGLFAHYFGDKDGLLEATLRFMAARLVRALRQRLRAAKTQRERLYAVPDSALADEEFERRTSAVWLAFWGQITHSTRYQRIQRIYQSRMLSNLRHDLRGLVADADVERHATMIASTIDGVWIRSHAAVTPTDAAAARAIVRDLIDGLIGGADRAFTATAKARPSTARIISRPASRGASRLVSPVTGADLGTFIAARQGEIEQAVDAAEKGRAAWRLMSNRQREGVLRGCADLIRAEATVLAREDALCTGRAMAQSLRISVPRAARAFERFAALAGRPDGMRIAPSPTLIQDIRRHPVGLVAGRGHWAAPLLSASLQIAPALAFGNALIFQPPELAPLTALRLASFLRRAGAPEGMLHVLPGDDATFQCLSDHKDIATPLRPQREAPAPKFTVIIFAGAEIGQAAATVLRGPMDGDPSTDLSETRVFVQRSALPALRTRLSAAAHTLICGDPLDAATDIGPLISAQHLRHVEKQIAAALETGAILVAGGDRDPPGNGLALMAPTILEARAVHLGAVRDSLFAPVVTLVGFEDDEDLVCLAAQQISETGAAIFDPHIAHALHIAQRLHITSCTLNNASMSADVDESRAFDSPRFAAQMRFHARYCETFWPGTPGVIDPPTV